ncbi:dynamin family protein [Aetokthonos hydrillicola Thurmond2011]|jgi:GTPase SAR1 family protein|uniref:Dynamin family protein n=1 Tax=Aetokthonos hydrillicola Thurmond2011 TaxID=2712845 RepID=A0AAP5IEN4_9CYAN|nr:dynamin family protein [Aetokthonos hydrillicola]MBO3457263.1 dynamin family protein [Aetokthonos hydrillicola CCALA 1050]MBW4586605.1 dynamin family protein [Aetokthonos hydrillicola CCALA 1050]MDR9900121.1 dynamin family protein [Aetokthonos hydrillicola Thurmond2011]
MPFPTDNKQLVLTLVGNLKQLRNFSEKIHLENLLGSIDRAIERLETDSFSIAVVGEFKRGKSTFINAILGEEILPADVLPTTATLNRLNYGAEPFVKIIFKDDEERDIAIHKLVSFVTKLTPESEAVAATVKEAVIYYPIYYCRDSVSIIDTPGLSDDESMTAVTLSVLDSVEVAIMVTSALAPFAESEGDFLAQKLLATNLSQVVFVVTGIDHLHQPQEVDKILRLVRRRIKDSVENWAKQEFETNSLAYKRYLNKIHNIKVFPLSAYQALSAKKTNDNALLAQSRFQNFELELRNIISNERGKIVVQTVINQVIHFSEEVIKHLDAKKLLLSSGYENAKDKFTRISELVDKFRYIKSKKILQISLNQDNIKVQTKLLVSLLEARLKQAVEQTVEIADITFSKDIDILLQQLANQVSNAVENASQSIASEIELAIERELLTGLQQVSSFLEIASEVMGTVETHINQLDDNITQSNSSLVSNSLNQALREFNQKQIRKLPNLFSSNSEAFLLKYEKNGLYTIVGGVAGSLFGPIGIAVGAAVGAGVGNSQKIKNLKSYFKSNAIAEIEKRLRSHNSNQIVDDYVYAVSKSLDKLKNHIDEEISSWIENTQNTLAKVQGKQQALVESEYDTIKTMYATTRDVLNRAWILYEQLYQNLEIDKENGFKNRACLNCSHQNPLDCKFCTQCGTRLPI